MYVPPLEEAKALIVKGDVDGGIQRLTEFLNGDFFHDEALFMLGNCLIMKGMNGLGAVVTSAAIDVRTAQKRGFPEALLNLGAAYKREHKNDMAERIWLDALGQESVPRERSKILANIAGLYINEGCPEKSLEWCEKAIAEDHKNYQAIVNQGIACLELGRWAEGWEGYAHIHENEGYEKRVYPGIPEWDGSEDETVIVWGDQGIGDEIYFACCLADMAKVCKRVILDCHPRLEALFRRSFPEFLVHGTRKDLTRLEWTDECGADAAIGLSSLPRFFRRSAEAWGDGAAYLKAMPVLKTGHGLRVGLSWTGGTKRTRTDLRSLSLRQLEPIVQAMPDAQWFSLQYTDNAAREVCDLEEHTGIRISHFPGWVETFDYDKTASFVSSLDVVITVCTTIHHLAGALGVPVWTLVPSRPSWRYQTKGETLPWYKSARLFRQTRDGDWSDPINKVSRELADFGQLRAA